VNGPEPEVRPHVERPRRETVNGRRRLRAELAAGARWISQTPAIGPGTLTRQWRRIVASILRTAAKPARALAERLGDPISMLPLAVEILGAEIRRILEAEAPGAKGRRQAALDPISRAFKRRGFRNFDRELRQIRGHGAFKPADVVVNKSAEVGVTTLWTEGDRMFGTDGPVQK